MTRRSQVEIAAESEAKLRKEKARLELDKVRAKREIVKHRRKMLSVHRAAERTKHTYDWAAPSTSADSAIVPDMARVNARARQVVRDDAYAKSIVLSFIRNVVGTGITASVDGKPFASEWTAYVGDARKIDVEGRLDLYGIQGWAIREKKVVGECFIVRWVLPDPIIGQRLVLQRFEFEQLDRYKLQDRDTGNEIRHGIEVDVNGSPVAYHFYRDHPNDIRGLARPAPLELDSFRVPASMVSHIYDPERVRQTHGISAFAPVLRKIRDLSEYDAAQLRVARAEASIGLLIKGMPDAGEDPLELDGLNVAYIGDDESVTSFTPSRPGGTYDPFMRQNLKAIAAGVGISYAQIARDFSDGNFSSQRQAAIEDRREFEQEQATLIRQLCRPVFNDWHLIWAMRNPELAGNFFVADRATPSVDWQGQGWEWVDPEQQGKGVERMMRLGLTTRTIEANRLGRSVVALDEQMRQDGTVRRLDLLKPDARESPALEEVANVD